MPSFSLLIRVWKLELGKVIQRRLPLHARGNRELLVEPLDFQESDDLVVRPFAIELDLRMLIGRAQRLDRRLAGVDVFLLQAVLLAQAFGPELAEPVAQVIERTWSTASSRSCACPCGRAA